MTRNDLEYRKSIVLLSTTTWYKDRPTASFYQSYSLLLVWIIIIKRNCRINKKKCHKHDRSICEKWGVDSTRNWSAILACCDVLRSHVDSIFYLKCVIQGAGKIGNQFFLLMKIIGNRTVAKMLAFNHLNE